MFVMRNFFEALLNTPEYKPGIYELGPSHCVKAALLHDDVDISSLNLTTTAYKSLEIHTASPMAIYNEHGFNQAESTEPLWPR